MARIKSREYAIGIIILVLVGAVIWKTQKPKTPAQKNSDNQTQPPSPSGQNPTLPSDNGKLEGELKISDDAKRGNLMLIMQDRTVYIFTGRDYSGLLNKQVQLQIDGSLENFRLIDIKAK